jgi:hypothetical protein
MKQQLLCRRIRLDQGRTVFTIAPAFVMPYMTGRTQDGVPGVVSIMPSMT